jgi:predicted DCC family thiol-disulfide oxidoreductase YuxK
LYEFGVDEIYQSRLSWPAKLIEEAGMTGISDSRTPISTVLMLYDGLCGFCNWSVRWVIKRDRHDRFRFAPQQSALAKAVLARHGVDQRAMLAANSVYLVLGYNLAGEQLLCRSDVTVQVLRLLGGGWEILGRVLGAVPRFLRDAVYILIARIRLRIAGRYDTCPLPSVAERAKFLA